MSASVTLCCVALKRGEQGLYLTLLPWVPYYLVKFFILLSVPQSSTDLSIHWPNKNISISCPHMATCVSEPQPIILSSQHCTLKRQQKKRGEIVLVGSLSWWHSIWDNQLQRKRLNLAFFRGCNLQSADYCFSLWKGRTSWWSMWQTWCHLTVVRKQEKHRKQQDPIIPFESVLLVTSFPSPHPPVDCSITCNITIGLWRGCVFTHGHSGHQTQATAGMRRALSSHLLTK